MWEYLGLVGLAMLSSDEAENWTLAMTIQRKVGHVVAGPLRLSRKWPAYFLHNLDLPVDPHDNILDRATLLSVVLLRELRRVGQRKYC